MLHIWHSRIAESPGEDRVILFSKHIKSALGQRHAFAQIFVRAPIEMGQLELEIIDLLSPFKYLNRFSRYIDADPVTGNNRYMFHFFLQDFPFYLRRFSISGRLSSTVSPTTF